MNMPIFVRLTSLMSMILPQRSLKKDLEQWLGFDLGDDDPLLD